MENHTMLKPKITWKYCIIMFYVYLHELIHHFASYVVCSDWGTKTFDYYTPAYKDQILRLYDR